MKRFVLVVALVSLPVVAGTLPHSTSGQQPKKADPAESVKAVKQAVTTFFDNQSQGRPDANMKLFLNEDVIVVGIANGSGREKIWQKKISECIEKDWKIAATPHTIDSTEVEVLDDTLAVARVKMHTNFVRGHWVLTFASEGGGWRIVACVVETRLP